MPRAGFLTQLFDGFARAGMYFERQIALAVNFIRVFILGTVYFISKVVIFAIVSGLTMKGIRMLLTREDLIVFLRKYDFAVPVLTIVVAVFLIILLWKIFYGNSRVISVVAPFSVAAFLLHGTIPEMSPLALTQPFELHSLVLLAAAVMAICLTCVYVWRGNT